MDNTLTEAVNRTMGKDGAASLINLEGITKVFLTDEIETHALSGIHLDVTKGEFLAISGPSGCGKSTLLAILGLLDSPTDGRYRLNGREVANLDLEERARIRNREVGFIFQSFNLIEELTVAENIELALLYHNMPSGERKERVATVMDRMGDLEIKQMRVALRVLQHIVLSHHGSLEFGAAKVPSTPEAIFVAHLDNLDAKTSIALRSA